jgi:hypothetical protein
MSLADFGVGASPRLPALENQVQFAVELRGSHTTADVAAVVQGIDDLAQGAVWGVLSSGFSEADQESDLELMARLSEVTRAAYEEQAAIPGWVSMIDEVNRVNDRVPPDNWGLIAISGTGQWLKRELLERDEQLYSEVFSFAQVAEARHESPLVIVIVLAPAAGIAGAAWLGARAIRWIYKVRRERAEARSAEARTRSDRVRADLIQQAGRELENNPDLLATLVDHAIPYLLPAAETLIDHPSVASVSLTDEGAAG